MLMEYNNNNNNNNNNNMKKKCVCACARARVLIKGYDTYYHVGPMQRKVIKVIIIANFLM